MANAPLLYIVYTYGSDITVVFMKKQVFYTDWTELLMNEAFAC